MHEKISVFGSPETESQYYLLYEAVLKQWPVPYSELYIPTRFGDTHVIASGSKDPAPLALFQPTGGGATIWFRNVGPFSQRFRTYAIDTIGEVNKSILTRPIRSRRDFADWIGDLFNGLQIESAHVVGNSFGGFLALNTALYLPERVEKIVLISPAATFVQIWAFYWHFMPAYIIASVTGSKRLVLRANEWIWNGLPKDERFAQLRTFTAMAGVPHHPPPSVFNDEELSKVRAPVLLLIGDHEVIYKPERVIRRATRTVANLRAEMIADANHNAELTNPDVTNAKILDFLRG